MGSGRCSNSVQRSSMSNRSRPALGRSLWNRLSSERTAGDPTAAAIASTSRHRFEDRSGEGEDHQERRQANGEGHRPQTCLGEAEGATASPRIGIPRRAVDPEPRGRCVGHERTRLRGVDRLVPAERDSTGGSSTAIARPTTTRMSTTAPAHDDAASARPGPSRGRAPRSPPGPARDRGHRPSTATAAKDAISWKVQSGVASAGGVAPAPA